MISMMKLAVSENVNQALQIMGYGMLGIFIVIGIIAIVVFFMTRRRKG